MEASSWVTTICPEYATVYDMSYRLPYLHPRCKALSEVPCTSSLFQSQ